MKLYVLYDAQCGLCSRVRAWMTGQETHIPVEFIPAASASARTLFPELTHEGTPRELVVVTSRGDVFLDDRAWIICLYALSEYRPWAYRLARGPLRPLARGAWHFLSSNRKELSEMFSLRSDAELADRLATAPPDSCSLDPEVG